MWLYWSQVSYIMLTEGSNVTQSLQKVSLAFACWGFLSSSLLILTTFSLPDCNREQSGCGPAPFYQQVYNSPQTLCQCCYLNLTACALSWAMPDIKEDAVQKCNNNKKRDDEAEQGYARVFHCVHICTIRNAFSRFWYNMWTSTEDR